MPPFSFSSIPTSRGRNADGTVEIRCHICGVLIKRSLTKFIAICLDCEKGVVPVDRIPPVDDLPVSLYTEDELASVAVEDRAGFIRTMFRSIGLIKPGAPKEKKQSQKVAKSKARRKLFSTKEDEKHVEESNDE
jgi:hypothetical protein